MQKFIKHAKGWLGFEDVFDLISCATLKPQSQESQYKSLNIKISRVGKCHKSWLRAVKVGGKAVKIGQRL